MSAGLGCRRGGSHSKATAVVYISVLISPEKKRNISEQTVNLTHCNSEIFLQIPLGRACGKALE